MIEMIKHDWPDGRLFWSVTLETDALWEKIRDWLARHRKLGRIQAIPRRVDGCFQGRVLMVPDSDRELMVSLIIRYTGDDDDDQ